MFWIRRKGYVDTEKQNMEATKRRETEKHPNNLLQLNEQPGER
jgi:hypothetical protein